MWIRVFISKDLTWKLFATFVVCFDFSVYLCKGEKKMLFQRQNHQIRDMKDRIRLVMESQHMTQGTFANFIGMSPASLSSIFNGRTKPTLNIVEAIKAKIPKISTDWLMFGSGQMYVDGSSSEPTSQQQPTLDFEAPSPTPQPSPSPVQNFQSVTPTLQNVEKTVVKYIDKQPRMITEIRIFYDDQTWETFVPKK